MRTFSWRPSPALLVAVLAISIALVGTAAAGPIDNPIAQDSRLTKKDRRIAGKISRNISLRLMRRFAPAFANQEITKRAPGLSVANAENATSADQADQADTADTADTVPDGAITTDKIANNAVTAEKTDASILKSDDLLSAIVNNAGGLVRGRGATSASRPATGDYRVTFNRDVEACVPAATPRLVGTARFATVRVDATGTAANEVRVRIWDPTGAASNFQFNLLILC